MIRFRNFLPLVAALLALALPNLARADFFIRATDVASGGAINASVTQSAVSNADGSGMLIFNSTVGNFTITLVTDITTTGPGMTATSQNLNITYNGPNDPTGATSDKLIIEVLGNKFSNPTNGAFAAITSNASPSTAGLHAGAAMMTSGVLSGNVSTFGAQGSTLGGQLGETIGIGSEGASSSVLMPNPVTGGVFTIPSAQFSFYQTYTLSGFTDTGIGSASAGSTVSAVPAPRGLVLVLAGAPFLALGVWLRHRKAAVQMA